MYGFRLHMQYNHTALKMWFYIIIWTLPNSENRKFMGGNLYDPSDFAIGHITLHTSLAVSLHFNQ